MPPPPCDPTPESLPSPHPATVGLSFHAHAAKTTRGKPEGNLPFEVHHAFWDSRGGVEGWQEFLSQLDGLYPEHLERKGQRALSILADEPAKAAGPRVGGLLGSGVRQACT